MAPRLSRRHAALALALTGVLGLTVAAASGVNLGTGTLQAGTGAVGSCQGTQTIAVSLTSTFSSGAYRSTAAQLTNIAAACQGKTYRVQLTSTSGTAIDMDTASAATDRTGTISGTSLSVSFPQTATASIGGIALVITG